MRYTPLKPTCPLYITTPIPYKKEWAETNTLVELTKEKDYLSSTVADAASRVFLISSASAVGTFSLITAGSVSMSFLESIKDFPVIPWTALMTATLEPAIAVTVTLTVEGPSAAAAPAAGCSRISAAGPDCPHAR